MKQKSTDDIIAQIRNFTDEFSKGITALRQEVQEMKNEIIGELRSMRKELVALR